MFVNITVTIFLFKLKIIIIINTKLMSTSNVCKIYDYHAGGLLYHKHECLQLSRCKDLLP
jgi:hypothetical protein